MMKSEERHKLQRNLLANWLGDAYRKVAPYAQSILVGSAALLVILVVVTWWRNQSAKASTSASDTLFAALGDTEKLDDLVAEAPNGDVGVLAALAAADLRLERGSRALFANRATASKDLLEAVEGYKRLVDGGFSPVVRSQAIFGRARAYEALMGTRQGGENYDNCLADYQEIETQGGAFSAHAKQRIASLKSSAVIEFYKKFSTYNPPASPPESGAFNKLPFDMNALSDRGEFSKNIMNLDDLKKKIDAKGSAEKPAAEKSQAVPPAKESSKAPVGAPAKDPAGAPAPAKAEVPKK